MISRIIKLMIFTAVFCGSVVVASSQPPTIPDATTSTPGGRREENPFSVKEMLAKQRLERDKKDYEEMLERGDEALRLMKQLEASFEQKTFSQQDRARLDSFEKVVIKIRKELGGADDSSDTDSNYVSREDEPKPSTVEEAFQFLQSTTIKFVDELKKTTRFSISAAAIQSSNTLLRLVKFIRLKK